MIYKEIKPENFEHSAFKMIGKDWMMISATDGSHWNAMTAAWGGVGVMWGKNVAYVVIRPQRYTKEFVDKNKCFSLSFFSEDYRGMLTHFGTVSGREEDKIKIAGLTPVVTEDAPMFEEAKTTMICQKLYAQDFRPECFIDQSLDRTWYPEHDYHTIYIAEIKKILIKE